TAAPRRHDGPDWDRATEEVGGDGRRAGGATGFLPLLVELENLRLDAGSRLVSTRPGSPRARLQRGEATFVEALEQLVDPEARDAVAARQLADTPALEDNRLHQVPAQGHSHTSISVVSTMSCDIRTPTCQQCGEIPHLREHQHFV